ncbi:MAG: electron transfer flavoprotein-ubiquinone oxidoreductase [Alphaproteobacteria bacterium]|nr:electron transfer flavoprotein-ubiquinone oxidoreductase [Alphaproteobacteria bacterium]
MMRETMEFDVIVVGGGPSGLAAAIRLRQLALGEGRDLGVCLIEKGSEIGAHILSGAVIETRALDSLLPDWKAKGAPLRTPVAEDRFLFLTGRRAFSLPTPPQMHNHGNYIVSLGNLCRWLALQAEAVGVEIFAGFAGASLLYDDNGRVRGVGTGDMGGGRDGAPTSAHQPGVDLIARQTILAEGCRGSLSKAAMERFRLRADCDPQCYGLGIKELWEVDPSVHKPGSVTHTIGWPLGGDVYGGSFVYHLEDHQVAAGFVVGLDYANPGISPFEEFQRFKTHPAFRPLFENGRRVAFGARALSEGGYQSIPRLSFPGGVLVGDAAGLLNVPKIKGVHTAMQSGILAAEAIFAETGPEAAAYGPLVRDGWVGVELRKARNIRPSFRFGLWGGIAYSALDTYVFRGCAPWTLRQRADHAHLKPAAACEPVVYPKPDGKVTFDRLSSLFLSGVNHEENQPVHLRLRDAATAVSVNLALYGGPEQHYCPAGVYEFEGKEGDAFGRKEGDAAPILRINAQNCLHCKTCDIKDPTQNIDWTTPEGGGGPNYPNM